MYGGGGSTNAGRQAGIDALVSSCDAVQQQLTDGDDGVGEVQLVTGEKEGGVKYWDLQYDEDSVPSSLPVN